MKSEGVAAPPSDLTGQPPDPAGDGLAARQASTAGTYRRRAELAIGKLGAV
jgi:hypothetical protein